MFFRCRCKCTVEPPQQEPLSRQNFSIKQSEMDIPYASFLCVFCFVFCSSKTNI